MPTAFTIRRLRQEDANDLRRVRLEGLLDTPEAFAASHEQDSRQPAEHWQQWLANTPSFGVFDGTGRLSGIAALVMNRHANLAHWATLGAMYVTPALRGSGAAEALVAAALNEAVARGLEQVRLAVNADNARALRVYRRMGFVEYGREPAGVRHAGIDHDVLLMVRVLQRAV